MTKYEIKADEIYGDKNPPYSISVHDIGWATKAKGKPNVARFIAIKYFVEIYFKRAQTPENL